MNLKVCIAISFVRKTSIELRAFLKKSAKHFCLIQWISNVWARPNTVHQTMETTTAPSERELWKKRRTFLWGSSSLSIYSCEHITWASNFWLRKLGKRLRLVERKMWPPAWGKVAVVSNTMLDIKPPPWRVSDMFTWPVKINHLEKSVS